MDQIRPSSSDGKGDDAHYGEGQEATIELEKSDGLDFLDENSSDA